MSLNQQGVLMRQVFIMLSFGALWCAGVQGQASAQVRDEVFAGQGDNYYDVTGAAQSVRHDAANGTGAPQLGLQPDYPSSLPAWKEAMRKFPREAAPYEPCVRDFIQATEEIKQVAPYMRRPMDPRKVNVGVARANDLIAQGDECMRRIKESGGGGIILRGGVTKQASPGPDSGVPGNGGLPPVSRGGSASPSRNRGIPEPTMGEDYVPETPQQIAERRCMNNPQLDGCGAHPRPACNAVQMASLEDLQSRTGCTFKLGAVVQCPHDTTPQLNFDLRGQILDANCLLRRLPGGAGSARFGQPSRTPGSKELPQNSSSPASERPDVARRRATLIELDELIGRAARYQPPLTSKFLTALGKGLRQDLIFLSQQPYVPAAQIANGLHTGLWGYLTGNAYENNSKLAGGVASSVSRTAQLVAQEPDVAAAELTHFLLQAAVTGGPGFGKGATGARLAAKVEQSAGVLQKLEEEVARRVKRPRAGGASPANAGWVRQFYRDIELLLPAEPLQPGGFEPVLPVQPRAGGCGQYSCSSILNRLGVGVNPAELMAQLPVNGTSAGALEALLRRNGVVAKAAVDQTIEDLERRFAQPGANPVIAGVGDTVSGAGHWVEVTGISKNSQGLRSFNVIDPAGFAYTKPIQGFMPHFWGFGGQVIYVEGRLRP